MLDATAYETALDALDTGVLLVRPTGTIAFCDASASADLGYDREELRRADFFDLLVPADERTGAVRALERGLSASPGDDAPATPVRTATGERRSVAWVEAFDAADGPVAVGRLRDRSAAWPVESLDPYRALVEQFPNGLLTAFDEELRFRVVGGPAFEGVDLSPADLRGARLGEALPAANADALRPLCRRALAGETNVTTLPLGDRLFEIRVRPLRDDDGTVVGGMTVSQDVTERTRRAAALQAARDRYESLIQNAPIPIFVGDESGTVHELNESAAALIGRPAEELVGESMLAVHPSDDAERYRAGIEDHVATGGTRRYLPDGEQIFVVDDEGDRVPVEISASVVEEADGTRVHAFFRDISDYVRYESALEALHERAGELVRAESRSDVADLVVEAAVESLDLQLVSVHLVDGEAEALSPVAHSDDLPDVLGDPPAYPFTGSAVGAAYLSSETRRVDEVGDRGDVSDSDAPVRSLLVVPMGSLGVVVCRATAPGAFDGDDERLLSLLARHAESVLARTERERDLRRRERELDAQTETLERLEDLNTQIRDLTRLAIQSETREELEQRVCDLLGTTEPFAFGWVGDLSPESDVLRPRARAGSDRGYLDDCSLSLEEAAEPAARTAHTAAPTVVQSVATDVDASPWRRAALARDFSAVVSVPITFEDVLYGVLTLYAEERGAITDRVRAVLTDWGEFMGYAIKEIERASGILDRRGTAARFRVTSTACPLLRIASRSHCEIKFEGARELDGETATVFLRLRDCSAERFRAAAERASAIDSVGQLGDGGDGAAFQVRITGDFVASDLARFGLRLQRVQGERDGGVTIGVVAPSTIPVHRVVAAVRSEYPGSELLATETVTDEPSGSDRRVERVLPDLTDRQREALELAYHGGYFESPKELSGRELAAEMGISSSAFHDHLRTAERALVESAFGGRSPPDPG